MNNLIYLMESGWFKTINSAFSILTLMLATAILIICVLGYGRSLRHHKEKKKGEPWLIVISTMFDSFLLGALYIVIEMITGAGMFRAALNQNSLVGYVVLFSPFITMLIYGLITYITLRRLFILRRWLDEKNSK